MKYLERARQAYNILRGRRPPRFRPLPNSMVIVDRKELQKLEKTAEKLPMAVAFIYGSGKFAEYQEFLKHFEATVEKK